MKRLLIMKIVKPVMYVLNIENFNVKPAVWFCEKNQFPQCERICSLCVSC
jgi:hypothetical protein